MKKNMPNISALMVDCFIIILEFTANTSKDLSCSNNQDCAPAPFLPCFTANTTKDTEAGLQISQTTAPMPCITLASVPYINFYIYYFKLRISLLQLFETESLFSFFMFDVPVIFRYEVKSDRIVY